MEDRLAHLRRMLGMLARGEEPYGGGRFDAKYLEIDQGDAQVLSAALDELEQRRASVTTGGPPPAFTETWENGPSSRPPTAPPEELVVALPVSDEEADAAPMGKGRISYRDCEGCGRSHPAWISCEAERQTGEGEVREMVVRATDKRDIPPSGWSYQH